MSDASFHPSQWQPVETGFELVRPTADHPILKVTRTGPEAWMLSFIESGYEKRLWLARDWIECIEWAGIVGAWEAEREEFRRRLPATPVTMPWGRDPAVTIKARKDEGGDLLIAAVHEGRIIASSNLRMTPLRARYILGEATISGSSHMNEKWMGKRLGEAMYDLAEQVAGVPRVPHGLNGNEGILTDASRRFWERRASSRRVPGMTGCGDVADRAARHAVVQYRLDLMSDMLDSNLADAVHRRTGWPVRCFSDGNGTLAAWCVMQGEFEGFVFGSLGMMIEERAIAVSSRFWRADHGTVRILDVPPGERVPASRGHSGLFPDTNDEETEAARADEEADALLRWHLDERFPVLAEAWSR